MYVSIILSIVKYLYRLESLNDGLLKQAYDLYKELHGKDIQTWYTSVLYILELLNLNIFACRNLEENQLINIVKRTLTIGDKKGKRNFWWKDWYVFQF